MAIGLSPDDVTDSLVEYKEHKQSLAYRTGCTKCMDYQAELDAKDHTIQELKQRPTKVYRFDKDFTQFVIGSTTAYTLGLTVFWIFFGFTPTINRALVAMLGLWVASAKLLHSESETNELYAKSATR